MKKKVAIRCLIGAPIGLALSTMITIAISLIVGDGRFYAVVSELIADCGTEMNAVLLQTVCSLLYGAAWSRGWCSVPDPIISLRIHRAEVCRLKYMV